MEILAKGCCGLLKIYGEFKSRLGKFTKEKLNYWIYRNQLIQGGPELKILGGMGSILCLPCSLISPIHLLILFLTLTTRGWMNLWFDPAQFWLKSPTLLYFISSVNVFPKKKYKVWIMQNSMLFHSLMWLNNFGGIFLKNNFLKLTWYVLIFSNFQIVRPSLVFISSSLLKGAAGSAKFMRFWCDLFWFAKRGNLTWTGNIFWAQKHTEDTGHRPFYLGFITHRLNHFSKLCEVSPFRYAHSCILYGSFVWEYESVQLDIEEWFLDGLGVDF